MNTNTMDTTTLPSGIIPDRDAIVGAVASAFRVTPEEILSRRRHEYIINARFCLYSLLYQKGWSLVAVGQACGRRDHGSVLHGIKTLKGRLEVERNLFKSIDALKELGYEL